MTMLTVPIFGKNIEILANQAKKAAVLGAQMVELRLDFLDALSQDMVRQAVETVRNMPPKLSVLVTARDAKEGGANDYPADIRVNAIVQAIAAGANAVDFEYSNFCNAELAEKIKLALSKTSKTRLILSSHNFDGKFENIRETARHIKSVFPAAIAKLVYTAKHINDCFEGLDLLYHSGGEMIVLCMGQAGTISRILAPKLGGYLTFASLEQGKETAAGQVNLEQMLKTFRFADINSQTELYGIVGAPVGHSASPRVHNAGFASAGLNKLYLPLLVDGGYKQFSEFMHNITSRPWLDFRGLSVTIPHKENALAYVFEKGGQIESLAKKIGAANTITISLKGELAAYNTDYAGALDAVTSTLGIDRSGLADMKVAVVGAGGVARAIVAGFADAGANVTIYNRTLSKCEQVAGEFNCNYAPLDELAATDAKILVNCTSLGMYPNVDSSILDKKYLRKDMVVFDTVYNPAVTKLLRDAQEVGAKTVSGVDMFINQAAAQFKLFTGKEDSVNSTLKSFL